MEYFISFLVAFIFQLTLLYSKQKRILYLPIIITILLMAFAMTLYLGAFGMIYEFEKIKVIEYSNKIFILSNIAFIGCLISISIKLLISNKIK